MVVIVVDECYRAYKRRKIRREVERQLGITPENRREFRRLQRQWERERRESQREYRRRRQRGFEGSRTPDEFSEAAGLGLPEYSLRPRDGVDRPVTIQDEEELSVNKQRKKGIRRLFKRHSESETVVQGGEAQRKKGWFRRNRERRMEDQTGASFVEGPPPPYQDIVGDDGGDSSITIGAPPTRNST